MRLKKSGAPRPTKNFLRPVRNCLSTPRTASGSFEQSFVIEIASNDGYLLQHFVHAGIPVLGIEPAENVARAALA